MLTVAALLSPAAVRLAPPMMQISDKCGGAVPFAPLGTAGGGSSATTAAMSGMTGAVRRTPGRVPQQRNRWPLDPNVKSVLDLQRGSVDAAPARAQAGGGVGAAAAQFQRLAEGTAAAGNAAGAADSAASPDGLRAMIEATTADKKSAVKARYDALLQQKDEQLAALSAEREAVLAELERECDKIDTEAAAALAFAV
ncbi:hypothetical protein EMIHUDRAFT_433891 [Emiliania huxleyi CCMP1516]|uniref:Uncharacterized protein n=2 Tax=Emiliania huxleyi TaxID=2903 RepID=A0A0D3JP41_EMIH1|nr:hypothetical protein EMIHUDRAFT_443695 [Emiliania huxleyi CCMP1516]XP_005787993.1 hypothetical protein EMIHUDRAFT_433891 [Emiliania huxleyi CCMP1516]EOD25276.1 hypothetical protein EMIHUDRAFT_443695 [Emiliania huxleyi CCMP1516]EOD35564.1 hypothetical protein EMIHUDRAFT_433891 [Emiliania huxleyi CCMP1516]|mmetsp:Transcript_13618/g.39793  ORF Transcript_13618/g.39793 Transcript_13618/m.39793 type:complete len:197 (-) Transcript_13618:293-883(-)|eukprot:XP_005777705.1 hypothetical protein EMIHUDRAFT_443695 [Emiliania huxleyi CCMP1516]